MKRPILLLSLIYLVGIYVFEKVEIDLIMVLLLSISFLTAYLRFSSKSFVYIGSFILAFINIVLILNPISDIELKTDYHIKAVIESKNISSYGFNYRLKVKELDHRRVNFRVNFISDDRYDIGNFIEGKASFDNVKSNKNFKMFNYEKYLMTKKVLLEVENDGLQYTGSNSFLLSIRSKASNFIENNLRSSFEKASGDFAISLVLGKKVIEKEDLDLYNELGLSHILAISGLHISVIISILDRLGKYLKIERKRFTLILILILLIYGYIIDFPVSLIRSLLMYSIRSFCIYTNNIQDDLNITGLSFFIMLLINPFYIYSQAFWYSFMAILSVVYLADLLKKNLKFSSSIMDKLISSISIQLAIFPIQIFLYNDINLLSVLINILIIPITSIPVILSFIAAFGLAKLFVPIVYIFESSVLLINTIVGFFSNYQNLSLSFQSYGLIIIVFYYFILIFFLNYRYLNRELKVKINHSIALTSIVILLIFNLKESLLIGKMNFIDVGQGDSILIRSNGKNLLVDVGGNFINPEKSAKDLYDYLYKNGVSRLDAVILTHDDFDHSGNLEYLKKLIVIDDIIVGPKFGANNFDVMNANTGDSYIIGDAILKIIYDGSLGENSNESSMVMEAKFGRYKVLLTGDIEENEDKLDVDDVDILKVSHHGSKNGTSEEFLRRITPEIAVISAGKDNRYGHPSKETIERLRAFGSKILSTMDEGNIEIVFAGDRYFTKTYHQKYRIWEILKFFYGFVRKLLL